MFAVLLGRSNFKWLAAIYHDKKAAEKYVDDLAEEYKESPRLKLDCIEIVELKTNKFPVYVYEWWDKKKEELITEFIFTEKEVRERLSKISATENSNTVYCSIYKIEDEIAPKLFYNEMEKKSYHFGGNFTDRHPHCHVTNNYLKEFEKTGKLIWPGQHDPYS